MMEHLNMQSMDKVAANVAKIRELFPNCVTERINNEGNLEHAIDFDMLKQELSDHVVDGLQERYQFIWPDKRKAILAANAPINKTLRPCREESVDFDNTENLYIEGDNLEVLKLLQETYLGKVKMIYIDPPYNTGNDFVYNDDFKQSADEYIDNSGQLDEEGNRLVANTESNGRFHTDWLNMMYPRLKLAKDLLSDDGAIFISIDDNEVDNLRKICDEIFGEEKFIGCIIRATGTTTAQGTDSLGKSYDSILIYSRGSNYSVGGIELTEKDKARYSYEDEKGKFSILQLRRTGGEDRREDRPSMFYGIKAPDETIIYPYGPSGYESRWRVGEDTYKKMLANNEIYFKKTEAGYCVYYKFYLEGRTKRPSNLWVDVEGNKKAQIDLKNLIKEKVFDTPKPIQVIKLLCGIANCDSDSLILDFFSGSATTAHAVMRLNAEDSGKRKFIMVQLPEVCAENSEAYKAGYKSICEIGKERIRRAGKKIKEENPLTTQDLDIGFRVLKCDSSNMEDVYFTPKEYMDKQQSLFVDNIKKDRHDEDLLFDAMLKLDTPLSSKIEKITIAGKTVYNVAQGHLMACFDKNVTDEVITAIAKEMPSYFVMRDSSQADDSVAINFEQIFNTYSPQTVRRVL